MSQNISSSNAAGGMQPRTINVYTKKMVKNQYHLATFNKPITDSSKLPAHVIEKPADPDEQQ